jgi:hypothetical protein
MRWVFAVLACVGVGLTHGALAEPPPTPSGPTSAPAPAASPSAPATPAAPAPAAVPVPAAQAPTAATATAASTTPASTTAAPEANDAALKKRLLSAGYRPEMRNGEKKWCRRETALGSRFETKVCGTAQTLTELTQSSKEMLEEGQRHRITPDIH